MNEVNVDEKGLSREAAFSFTPRGKGDLTEKLPGFRISEPKFLYIKSLRSRILALFISVFMRSSCDFLMNPSVASIDDGKRTPKEPFVLLFYEEMVVPLELSKKKHFQHNVAFENL